MPWIRRTSSSPREGASSGMGQCARLPGEWDSTGIPSSKRRDARPLTVKLSDGLETTGLAQPDDTGQRPLPKGWRRPPWGTGSSGATEAQVAEPMEPEERFVAQIGSSQAILQEETVIALRGGGVRRPFSPCHRCLNCGYRQGRDYSAAQDSPSPSPGRPTSSRRWSTFSSRRSTSHRRRNHSPKRDTTPGPPQLWRVEAQLDETSTKDEKCTLSWADSKEQFSLGAMSQGSGSPVTFLDTEACEDILKHLKKARTARLQILTATQDHPLQRWRQRWPASKEHRPPPQRTRTNSFRPYLPYSGWRGPHTHFRRGPATMSHKSHMC